MSKTASSLLFGGAAVLAVSLLMSRVMPVQAEMMSAQAAPPAPAFTHPHAQDWLNSTPLEWKDLRGKVVLIDVWTFDCWNCYRSIPWLHSLEEKFPASDFQIIGVHTPELPQEYVLDNVRKKLKEFKITHPVMVDNDYSYWKALDNAYWPAFYTVDKQGKLRSLTVGETHEGDRNAKIIEAHIAHLIAERPPHQ